MDNNAETETTAVSYQHRLSSLYDWNIDHFVSFIKSICIMDVWNKMLTQITNNKVKHSKKTWHLITIGLNQQ